jgi:hypothetical protein
MKTIVAAYKLWREGRKIKNSLKEADMEKVKAGIKTSEFWLALLGAVLPVLNGQLGLNIPAESILTIGGVIASYVIGRSITKKAQ